MRVSIVNGDYRYKLGCVASDHHYNEWRREVVTHSVPGLFFYAYGNAAGFG